MKRTTIILVGGLALGACRPSSGSSAPSASASSAGALATGSSSAASVPASASAAPRSSLDALPKPPAKPRAAIRTMGYPQTVGTGMNDPAAWVGFTKDGSEYGYCADLGGRDPQVTRCVTTLRDGSTKTRTSDDDKGYSPALMKELTAWRTPSGLTQLTFKNGFDHWMAKPVTGEWEFSDLTIWVNQVPGDGTKVTAVVKVGGAVDGEQPVYPVVLQPKAIGAGVTHHTSWTNDLSISPDGTELGVVGGFFCAEWCDDFVVYRNGTAAFASLVYNDTGFRHHQKGEYARAADLFLAATFADPKAKLPPYNLACAWARLGDERAKDALAVAIERDPTAKARAAKDADFERVKSSPWFVAMIAP